MADKKKSPRATSSNASSQAVKAAIESPRGVKSWAEAAAWLRARGIEDVECITPDLAGVPRGKMMPSSKFTSNTSLALPSALYGTRSLANIRTRRRTSVTIPAIATSSWCRTFRR